MPTSAPIILHKPYIPTPYPEMVDIKGGKLHDGE